MSVGDATPILIAPDDANALCDYVSASAGYLRAVEAALRTEAEARGYCTRIRARVARTRTKLGGHHQSSKAMVSAVGAITASVCKEFDSDLVSDPVRRAVWCGNGVLHTSVRNLDGAIPSLFNPAIVWEIKEYWGKTSGGSKMSDAVYECHLVGRELREFERRSGMHVNHVVFIDGKQQWSCRRSDLVRFIDLLIVGREVETEWETTLRGMLGDNKNSPRTSKSTH